jgi:hypothetical protein
LAMSTLYAIVLPVAGLLEGVPIWIKVQDLPVVSQFEICSAAFL